MSATANTMFKGYSAKAKAKRALASYGEAAVEAADKLLHMGDVDGEMKWGFNVTEVEALVAGNTPAASCESLSTTAEAAGSVTSEEEEEESTAPVASASMFASIGATLGNVAANNPSSATDTSATRAASRSSYVIEKDRPEQNGIKRPSAGGLCRAVWDSMDHHRDITGAVPNTNDVRFLAEKNNWNKNNAMIEYYQWRKFNGISGRIAAAKPAPVAA